MFDEHEVLNAETAEIAENRLDTGKSLCGLCDRCGPSEHYAHPKGGLTVPRAASRRARRRRRQRLAVARRRAAGRRFSPLKQINGERRAAAAGGRSTPAPRHKVKPLVVGGTRSDRAATSSDRRRREDNWKYTGRRRQQVGSRLAGDRETRRGCSAARRSALAVERAGETGPGFGEDGSVD